MESLNCGFKFLGEVIVLILVFVVVVFLKVLFVVGECFLFGVVGVLLGFEGLGFELFFLVGC